MIKTTPFFTFICFSIFVLPVFSNVQLPEKWLERLETSSSVMLHTPGDLELKQLYIVDFFATWCAPCRLSVPHLNKLYNKFNQSINFITLSNENNHQFRKFWPRLRNKPLSTVIVDEYNGLFSSLRVDGFPTTIIFNNKSEVIWRGHPNRLNSHVLKKLLQDNAE